METMLKKKGYFFFCDPEVMKIFDDICKNQKISRNIGIVTEIKNKIEQQRKENDSGKN